MIVMMSEGSKKLINQLSGLIKDETLKEWNQRADTIEQKAVVVWLMQQIEHDKESAYPLEALRTSLLKDLHPPDVVGSHGAKKKSGWFGRLQLIVLAVAGTVLAICQGFDGIASLLYLFSAVPIFFVFLAGIIFSILSVAVFIGFDLIEISKNLGVKWSKPRQLLHVFVDQVEEINHIRNEISDGYTEITDPDALDELKKMVAMLIVRFNSLDEARAAYAASLHNPTLKIGKFISSLMSGVLFFGGGYFAGQSLSLAIASIFVASVSAAFWPIIVSSVAVGLAALCIYWFVERPGLENLVGRWVGLDKDNVDALVNDEKVNQHKNQLCRLERCIDRHIASQQYIEQLHNQIALLTGTAKGSELRRDTPIPFVATSGVTTSASPDAFFNYNRPINAVATSSNRENFFDEGNGNFTLGNE